MSCTACGHDNPAGNRFCGAALTTRLHRENGEEWQATQAEARIGA